MLVIKLDSYYRRCKTKLRWCAVDALLTPIFRMWFGAWVCEVSTSTRLIRRKLAMTYQCQYLRLTVAYLNATINVKPKMQNLRLEPTGLAKPCKTRDLTVMGPGLASQQLAGWVFGLVWNRIDLFLRSKSRLLAGYSELLLTLTIMLTVCPGSFENLFTIWNLSYCWSLLVFSLRFFDCSI
jgi:hypothetical protein